MTLPFLPLVVDRMLQQWVRCKVTQFLPVPVLVAPQPPLIVLLGKPQVAPGQEAVDANAGQPSRKLSEVAEDRIGGWSGLGAGAALRKFWQLLQKTKITDSSTRQLLSTLSA